MNAIMKEPPVCVPFLIVQGPDGKNEEVELGMMVSAFTAKRIADILNRYGVRAQIEMREYSVEKKY